MAKARASVRRRDVAAMMASRWASDELMKKLPEDLIASYGVNEKQAVSILKSEISRRRLLAT